MVPVIDMAVADMAQPSHVPLLHIVHCDTHFQTKNSVFILNKTT